MSRIFGEMIYSYTRSDALRDGVLIAVDPEICADAGIVYPVAITDRLWGGYIDPGNLDEMPGQSVAGRLWDLLWMFRTSAKGRAGDRLKFPVNFQLKTGKTPVRWETITVIAACGPGDEGEPVLTFMLPEDD